MIIPSLITTCNMEKCSDVNVNQKITYKRGTILSQYILLRFNFLINVSTRTEFIHKTALYHTWSSSIIMQVKKVYISVIDLTLFRLEMPFQLLFKCHPFKSSDTWFPNKTFGFSSENNKIYTYVSKFSRFAKN